MRYLNSIELHVLMMEHKMEMYDLVEHKTSHQKAIIIAMEGVEDSDGEHHLRLFVSAGIQKEENPKRGIAASAFRSFRADKKPLPPPPQPTNIDNEAKYYKHR